MNANLTGTMNPVKVISQEPGALRLASRGGPEQMMRLFQGRREPVSCRAGPFYKQLVYWCREGQAHRSRLGTYRSLSGQ